ncbi:hypothetical protein QE408_002510 [Agrobacterium larrymoorei]|uniref:Uncharacterized protein n=1 Tax=Agrobacterium larrymoorei TaxID=160699 RepID=A0ABU0UK94_9HYPH|nr:hypothetical protein [Agrobacterium larrymoorei]
MAPCLSVSSLQRMSGDHGIPDMLYVVVFAALSDAEAITFGLEML